jgi:hypothetical protein
MPPLSRLLIAAAHGVVADALSQEDKAPNLDMVRDEIAVF